MSSDGFIPLEELWVLGSPAAVDTAIKQVEAAVAGTFAIRDLDVCRAQLWWKGQLVGHSFEMVNDKKGLESFVLQGLKKNPSVSVLLFSCDSPDQVRVEGLKDGPLLLPFTPGDSCFQQIREAHQAVLASQWLDRGLTPDHSLFESLALADDLTDFRKALSTITWTAQNVEAWWRCSESWLRRWSCVPDPEHNRLGRPNNNDDLHQMQVLSALAESLPVELLDESRAIALAQKSMGSSPGRWDTGRSALFATDRGYANAHWLRGLLGNDAAWKALNVQVSFINDLRQEAVSWFGGLPISTQYDALDDAWSVSAKVLSHDIAPENRGVSPAVPSLLRHCPTWPHWEEAYEEMALSRRASTLIQNQAAAFRSGNRLEALSMSLPSASKPSRPKPRF